MLGAFCPTLDYTLLSFLVRSGAVLMSELGGMTLSKLRFYSIGVVAQNKALGSHLIEVTPIEEVPFADGEITAKLERANVVGTDANGASYSANMTGSLAISANWLRLAGGNRLTAPDVRRGETVVIYQFGDTDKYYWTTLRDDHSLRRLETAIYGWSGSPVEDTPVGKDTMYWLEISTHRKVVHFHTSKANGEPFAYDIQLNTKDGALIIQDDIGNYIHLDSRQRRIELKNTDGSHYDMLQENLTVTIPKKTRFVTTDFVVEASNTASITATNAFSVATKVSDINASEAAAMKSKDTTIIGSSKLSQTGDSVSVSGSTIDVSGGDSISIISPATTII
jgi:hypothetical protein